MIKVSEQRTALAAALGSLSGIKKVFSYMPLDVQARELPCLILNPQTAEYDRERQGAESLLVIRRWEVILLAKQAEAGREFEAEQAAEALIESTLAELAERTVIRVSGSDDRAFDVLLTGDRGVTRYVLAEKQYAAVGFNLTTEAYDFYASVD